MAKPSWNGGYSGQTLDELIGLADQFESWSLLFPIELALQQKSEKLGEAGLSSDERLVLAVEALEREVNNGGYSQFFINSSRQFAPILVEALEKIGCLQTASISKQAIEVLSPSTWTTDAIASAVANYRHLEKECWVSHDEGPIMHREAQKDSHEDIFDRLDTCDQQFYSSGEDIGGQLFSYIKAHRETIKF